jgi:hypothetical protein
MRLVLTVIKLLAALTETKSQASQISAGERVGAESIRNE